MMASSGVRQRDHKRADRQGRDTTEPGGQKTSGLREESSQITKCCGRVCKIAVVLLLLGCVPIILLSLKSSPIDAHEYTLLPPPSLTGPLAPNHRLQNARRLLEGRVVGPESLVMKDGRIYSGTHDGKVIMISNDTDIKIMAQLGVPPCGPKEYESTCGRPLGVRIDGDKLVFLDGYFGLYEMDITGDSRPVELLSSKKSTAGVLAMKLPNDLDILENGDVIFTDSSYNWHRRDVGMILMESAPCGRLLKYNRASGKTEVLMDGLFFANGVQISPDQDFVLVVETTRYRILKYHLRGPKAGSSEVFIDNLPGCPDNIRPSHSGGYWVGLAFAGGRLGPIPIDFLGPRPWLRNAIAKVIDLADYLHLFPSHGIIIELNQDGEIVQSLHDPVGKVVGSVSEILDTGDALYMGSYHAPYLLKLDI